jgi:hypothetical protein
MESWPRTLTLISKMVQIGVVTIIFRLTKQPQRQKLVTLRERPIYNNVKDLMHNYTQDLISL